MVHAEVTRVHRVEAALCIRAMLATYRLTVAVAFTWAWASMKSATVPVIIGSGLAWGPLGTPPTGGSVAYHPGAAFPRPKGTRAGILEA